MNLIASALTDLNAALTGFVDLLERESACLNAIDADTLSAIVAQKTQQAELSNTAWNRLIVACGLPDSQGGKLDAALSAYPNLKDRWLGVKQLVEQAGRLNQANSILIEAQMRRTRQAMEVLQSASDRGLLYGADGLMIDNLQRLHSLNKV